MTAVYVVTSGVFSDYTVRGVYSTLEKAERARELFNSGNPIVAWELDKAPVAPPPGYRAWSLVMDRTGNTPRSPSTCDADLIVESRTSYNGYPMGDPGASRKWCFYALARDAEHAVKICNERRSALLASGDWDMDHARWKELAWHGREVACG